MIYQYDFEENLEFLRILKLECTEFGIFPEVYSTCYVRKQKVYKTLKWHFTSGIVFAVMPFKKRSYINSNNRKNSSATIDTVFFKIKAIIHISPNKR